MAETRIVRVPVPAGPSVALVPTVRTPLPTLIESGPVGRTGPEGGEGPEGPQGPSGDYGTMRYSEMINLPATEILPGVDTPFAIAAPMIVDDRLTGPFVGHAFFDEAGFLRARRANDSYLVRVRLSVTAMVAGGAVTVNILIPDNVSGLAGPSGSKTAPLSEQAGDEERVDILFQAAPGAGFIANGAQIVIRSSVPAHLKNESLFITPLVAAPGP